MLIILSGLPGVGKTTIARELARSLAAVHLRIDSIEQALRQSGLIVEAEGYAVAHAVAADNLRAGQTVVADCVNPWPLTRDQWRAVAERMGVPVVEVEVVCSDQVEHRRRVESRAADIAGHRAPTWQEVVERDYRAWDRPRVVIDTAKRTVPESVQAVTSELRSRRSSNRIADADRPRTGQEYTVNDERMAPETKGVTVKVLATVDLGPEIEGMAGRQLRMRMVTIEPGGVFGPIHDHKDRPGTVYILQGTITDHRNGVATDYGPGVGWPEDRNTTHWLENRGTIPAVEISVDIVRQE